MATGVIKLGRLGVIQDPTQPASPGSDFFFTKATIRRELEPLPDSGTPTRPDDTGSGVPDFEFLADGIVDAINAVPSAMRGLCAQWLNDSGRARQEAAAKEITRRMLQLGGDAGATGELPAVGEFKPEQVFGFATRGCDLLCKKLGPCCEPVTGDCVGSSGGAGPSTTVEEQAGGGGKKPSFRKKRGLSTPVKVGLGLGAGVGGALLLRALL